MLKQKPDRLTYAQEKLISLIEERKLRRWCLDSGITHSAAYRLALGEQVPTYRIIASMCHLIAPIEWLYFTDEKLPYEPVLVPQWTCERPCKYVKEHRYDYRTVAKKYNLEMSNAYNIFVAYRANPTPIFIREACKEVNPIEFFTDSDSDIKSLKEYIPNRGDIVSVEEKLIFVVTKQEQNEKNKTYTGCLIFPKSENGIPLSNSVSKGVICPYHMLSFKIIHTIPRTLIEKAEEGLVKTVMDKIYTELQ